MQKAEILRRDEVRGDAAAAVAGHGRDPIGDRNEFAALIFGDGDLPAPLHRAPDQIEGLPGWETLTGHRNRRAGWAMCRLDRELPNEPARGLGHGHFRTQL